MAHNYLIDKDTLETRTIANYKAAVNYYLQKEQNFAKYAIGQQKRKTQQEIKRFQDNFSQAAAQELAGKWQNEVVEKIKNHALNIEPGKSGKYQFKDGGEQIIMDLHKKGLITEAKRDRILKGADSGDNIYSILGFAYEDYVSLSMQQVESLVANGVDEIVASVMSQFSHTGAHSSRSTSRANRSIRPDLGINMAGSKVDGILYGQDKGKKLSAVELQVELQMDYSQDEDNRLNKVSDETILRKYLRDNMYGLSLKNWAGESFNNKEFTTMTSLQKELNDFYASQNRPISLKYAGQVMNYEASRKVFDIAGITNIGVLTGKKFIWMSSLLSEYFFSMELAAKSVDRNEDNEQIGFASIINDSVLLRRAKNLLTRNSLIGAITQRKEIDLTDKSGKVIDTVIPINFRVAKKTWTS